MRALVLLVVLVAAAGDDADDDDDAPEYGQRTHSNSKRQSVEAAAPSIVPIYNSHPSDEYLQQLYARASIGARGGYTGVPQGWLGMGYAMDSSSSSAHRRPQNTSISDNKASTAGKSPASSRRRTSHATAQRLKCVNSRKLKCTRVRIKQQPPVTSQHNGGHRLHPADNLHRRLQLRNGNTLQLGSKRSLRNAEFEGGHWRRGFERSLVAGERFRSRSGEPKQWLQCLVHMARSACCSRRHATDTLSIRHAYLHHDCTHLTQLASRSKSPLPTAALPTR